MRVGLYARVSTNDQTCENQLLELRRYAGARGWEVFREYIDHGVSGAKESRPALDEMLRDAKRRRFDALCFWSLDRLGRSLKHLITILDDLHAVGITFVSLKEGLDLGSPAGRLQWQIIAAISEFERSRISERVRTSLQRLKAEGRTLGRPKVVIPEDRVRSVAHLTVDAAADALSVSRSTLKRWRRAVQQTSNLRG